MSTKIASTERSVAHKVSPDEVSYHPDEQPHISMPCVKSGWTRVKNSLCITANVSIKLSFLHTRIPLLTVSANVSYMEKLSLLLTNLLRNLVVGECDELLSFIARSVNGFGEQSKTL